MFKRILLTTDFSPEADSATPLALDFAAHYDAPLDVLHVIESAVDFGPGFSETPIAWTTWLEDERRRAREQLSVKVRVLSKVCKTQVQSALREGHPAQQIVAYAIAKKIDCIVMATHGRSGFSRLVLGSNAERVVRHSHCAVLTVRPSALQFFELPFKKIVMPTDLSVNADAVRPVALDLARRYVAEIHVIHIFDHSLFYARGADAQSKELQAILKMEETRRLDELRKYASNLRTGHAGTLQIMKPGKPADSILSYAESIDADCIVLSTHGRSGLSHMLIGSVADRLVRTAPCPVLTFKPNKIISH